MPEDTSNLLCVVNGLERSGTIWATRLLGDALNLPTQTRYHGDEPFDYDADPAVWGEWREGKLIRRLHHYPAAPNAPVLNYPYPNIPAIVVVRDPRDIGVSQYYFHTQFKSPDLRTAKIASGRSPLWARFYFGWLEDERMLTTVRYEDLRLSPAPELRRIILTLGLEPDLDAIDDAIYNNEFSHMRNWAKRKGIVGGWREELSSAVADRVWERCKDAMRLFGYTRTGVLYDKPYSFTGRKLEEITSRPG